MIYLIIAVKSSAMLIPAGSRVISSSTEGKTTRMMVLTNREIKSLKKRDEFGQLFFEAIRIR